MSAQPAEGFRFRPGTSYYSQIKEDLIRKCADGTYAVDARVPPELELAKEYGVSRPTIRQAVLELVREGVFSRMRGRGTFVLPPVITSDAHSFLSFADEMRAQGIEHAARLLETRELRATESIADELQIQEGDRVYEIVRLRIGNGEPLVLRTLQLPASLAPGLLGKPIEERPIYEILRTDYGIVATWSTQYFSAIAADGAEAAAFEIPAGAPLLSWRGVTYTAAGGAIAITKGLYRGDRFRFALVQGTPSRAGAQGPAVRIESIAGVV